MGDIKIGNAVLQTEPLTGTLTQVDPYLGKARDYYSKLALENFDTKKPVTLEQAYGDLTADLNEKLDTDLTESQEQALKTLAEKADANVDGFFSLEEFKAYAVEVEAALQKDVFSDIEVPETPDGKIAGEVPISDISTSDYYANLQEAFDSDAAYLVQNGYYATEEEAKRGLIEKFKLAYPNQEDWTDVNFGQWLNDIANGQNDPNGAFSEAFSENPAFSTPLKKEVIDYSNLGVAPGDVYGPTSSDDEGSTNTLDPKLLAGLKLEAQSTSNDDDDSTNTFVPQQVINSRLGAQSTSSDDDKSSTNTFVPQQVSDSGLRVQSTSSPTTTSTSNDDKSSTTTSTSASKEENSEKKEKGDKKEKGEKK